MIILQKKKRFIQNVWVLHFTDRWHSSIRYSHSMWKRPIFRAIDSCSKYREIPEAFVHSHPALQFLSVRLNIERIALVFFVKEKDKEWQWNVLSSYFSSSESNVSRIFWHDLRVRLRVRKEAKSDRPRRWELYHGNGESYYGVGDEYDRPGPMNASVRVCTMRVFSSTVAYPHRPRPIEKQMKTTKVIVWTTRITIRIAFNYSSICEILFSPRFPIRRIQQVFDKFIYLLFSVFRLDCSNISARKWLKSLD